MVYNFPLGRLHAERTLALRCFLERLGEHILFNGGLEFQSEVFARWLLYHHCLYPGCLTAEDGNCKIPQVAHPYSHIEIH